MLRYFGRPLESFQTPSRGRPTTTRTSHARELDWLLFIAARTSPADSFALTAAVLEELDFAGGRAEAVGQPEAITRRALVASLNANDWNRNAVARELGITRFRVYSLLEKFGLKGE